MGIHLSDNGSAVIIESFYDHVARYFDLAHRLPAIQLGRLNYVELLARGTGIAALNMDGDAVYYDLTAPPATHTHGVAFANDVCKASGDAVRPFPAVLRDPILTSRRFNSEDRDTYEALRGLPWHPCDWRGIMAGPEGWMQFFRWIRVRYFGSQDYLCEERDAEGHRDSVSVARCNHMRELQ
jgi:hypothetical protein